MTLPPKAIERLFERLLAIYGAQFSSMWRDVPIDSVKAAWAHELAGFGARLDALGWALDHLPERCPNAVEFRNLCRLAPREEAPALPPPPQDRARVAELLRTARASVNATATHDPLSWARRILQRQAAGEPVHFATAAMARQAITRSAAHENRTDAA